MRSPGRTAFVGRATELVEIRVRLERDRMITLTGMGGVGKTRLAQEVVRQEEADRYPEGVWWIDLTVARSADALFEAVLRAVDQPQGHNFSGTLSERLIESLKGRTALLVLDNCEHVLVAVRALAHSLLKECGGISLLATSREPLSVVGEHIVTVEPMSLPELGALDPEVAATDAVQLFCDRANARRPDFHLSDANAQDVAELCRRLDGIPLAIELAAARISLMTAADLLDKLNSPLEFLVSKSLGHDERHRTLRATLDWSYDLLDERERLVFSRCAVFTGGFSLAAVEAVAAGESVEPTDMVDVMSHLVDKSLLSVHELGGSARYRMLDTIREYANERFVGSSDESSIRERHGMYFRDFAVTAGAALVGPGEGEWIERVEPELGNLATAIEWALSTYRITVATDIVVPLGIMQGAFDEIVGAWSERILDYPYPEQDPRRPGVAAFACYVRYFYRGQGEAADIVRNLVENVRPTEAGVRLTILNLACGLALLNGWPFRPLTERYAIAAREADDAFHLVHATSAQTWAGLLDGEDSRELGEVAVGLAQHLGNQGTLAVALQAQAMASSATDPKRSVALLDQSIAAAASVRSHFTLNVSRSMRTGLLLNSMGAKAAVGLVLESLDGPLSLSLPALGRVWMVEVAAMLALGGRPEAAGVLLGGIHGADPGAPVLWPFAPPEFRSILRTLPEELGALRWSELQTRGSTMTGEELISFARAEAEALPAAD